MLWRDRLLTLTFPPEGIMTTVSLLFFMVHLGIFINDLNHFFNTYLFDQMSFRYTVTLLFSQVMSFLWAAMGSLYAEMMKKNFLRFLSLVSLVLNTLMFFLRLILELFTMDYREEQH
ncbi:transmembrane protein 262 [Ornithorhynchus anatinus]|uniref:Transmembrane protein 262 n=1 Tax=Ornithorhynchus anatinus TaxID=9258 RepID=A0A6I8PAP7_ORNAN|nr:transmembrane protein 262 [Ornithorhynchus anatinus]